MYLELKNFIRSKAIIIKGAIHAQLNWEIFCVTSYLAEKPSKLRSFGRQ
jgi:hypothetical protein